MNKIRMDYQKILTLIFCMLASVNTFAAGNSVETATLVPVNVVINAELTVADTYDYYRLEVTEEGVLTLDGSGGERLEMYLLDEGGSNIGVNYNYTDDNQETSIVHKVTPGTYYIRLITWSYLPGSYNVISTFLAGTDDAGDTEDTALLVDENMTANYAFEVPGDIDYFRINVVEKGNLSVKYTGMSEVQFAVTGVDTNENFFSGGPATVSTSDGILYTSGVIPPGDYYVRLFLNDDSFGVGSYALETTFISVGDDHGDEITSATLVSLENYSGTVQVQGSIETSNDSDLFRIDLLSKKTVVIFAGGGEYIGGTLFDSTGVELDRNNNILGGYEDFSFKRVLSPGTYYVRAGHYGPSDSTPSYTMYFSLLPVTTGDFGGNGTADILIRNGSGYISLLQMNGSSIESATGVTGLSIDDWAIAGIADFNNDQKSDILIRNTDTGYISLYQMNGANILSLEGVVDLSPDNWTIVGTADFNGDGNAGILIRHTTSGYLSLIQMDGSSVTSITGIMGLDPNAWSIEGLGDFGGDGKADILIRRIGSGYLSLIQMDGSTILSILGIDNLDTDWGITGIADFDGDSRADILIRNSGGYMSLLQMNGSTIDSIEGIDGLPLAWVIQSTGDQTGDGKADILIRNGTGYMSLIEMNGSGINSITGIDHLHTDWAIQNQTAHIN